MKIKIIMSLCVYVVGSLCYTSCGNSGNIFSSAVEKNDKEKARSALLNGDYDTAIKELSKYIAEHPEDTQARSLLASAQFKKVGIDELTLVSSIAEAQKNTSASGSDWKTIVTAMPAGTQTNIDALKSAVDNLSAIPAEQRTEAQKQQLLIASSTLAVTVVKQVVDDGSGNYTPTQQNVDKITPEQATLVVSNINTASENATGIDGASSGLAGLSTKIAEQPGTSDLEKLQAFLKNQK